jgi:hypothetical protein
VTLQPMLDPSDQGSDSEEGLWASLTVDNPLQQLNQQAVPILNFGC